MKKLEALKSKFTYYIWYDYIKNPISNLYYVAKRKIKKLWHKPKYKRHHYLQEIYGKDLPFPFSEKDYPAFDERDTFDFDQTFVDWMYERLRYFQDQAFQIVEKKCLCEIDGELLTPADCVDRMICDCKKLMKVPDFDYIENTKERMDTEDKYIQDSINDLLKVFAACYQAMWW